MGVRTMNAKTRHNKLALFDARYEFKRSRKEVKTRVFQTTYPNLKEPFEKAAALFCGKPSTDSKKPLASNTTPPHPIPDTTQPKP